MAHNQQPDGEPVAPILTGAFSTRHVSPAILQHRIFELTQERDAARRECQSLREQLAKAASETAIAKPIESV